MNIPRTNSQLSTDSLSDAEFTAYLASITAAINAFIDSTKSSNSTVIAKAADSITAALSVNGRQVPLEVFSNKAFIDTVLVILETKNGEAVPALMIMLARIAYRTTNIISVFPENFVENLFGVFSSFPAELSLPFVKFLVNITGEMSEEELKPLSNFVPQLLEFLKTRELTIFDLVFFHNIYPVICPESCSDEDISDTPFVVLMSFLAEVAFSEIDAKLRRVAMWTIADMCYKRSVGATQTLIKIGVFDRCLGELPNVPPEVLVPLTCALKHFVLNDAFTDGEERSGHPFIAPLIPIDFFAEKLSREEPEQTEETLKLFCAIASKRASEIVTTGLLPAFLAIIQEDSYKLKIAAALAISNTMKNLENDELLLYPDAEQGLVKAPPGDEEEHDYIIMDVMKNLFEQAGDGDDEKLGIIVIKFIVAIRSKLEIIGCRELFEKMFEEAGGPELLDKFSESEIPEIHQFLDIFETDIDLYAIEKGLHQLKSQKRVCEARLGIGPKRIIFV